MPPGAAGYPEGQDASHDAFRTTRAVSCSLRRPPLLGLPSQVAAGCRHHVCARVIRVGVRRLRHRRELAPNRGLADLHQPVHQPCPGRLKHGHLTTTQGRRRSCRHRPPLRPRSPVPVSAMGRLLRTARRWRRWGPRLTLTTTLWPRGTELVVQGELIRNKKPWRSTDDVEVATAEWVHWYNAARPHSAIGMLTPVERGHAHHTKTGAEVADRPYLRPPNQVKQASTNPGLDA